MKTECLCRLKVGIVDFSKREGIFKISNFNYKCERTCFERQVEGIDKRSELLTGSISKNNETPCPDSTTAPGPLLTLALVKVKLTASNRLSCRRDCHLSASLCFLSSSWDLFHRSWGRNPRKTKPSKYPFPRWPSSPETRCRRLPSWTGDVPCQI